MKKIFKVTLILITVALLVSGLWVCIYLSTPEDQSNMYAGRLMWSIHDAEKNGSAFQMRDLTDFDWDRLYIFPSGTTNEQISTEIGVQWKGLSRNDEENQEVCFIFFVKNKKVAQFFRFHKFYGDFSQAYQKGGYSPHEAVFNARKSTQLLHGEYPSLVIKTVITE